jgi:hypothetical protein
MTTGTASEWCTKPGVEKAGGRLLRKAIEIIRGQCKTTIPSLPTFRQARGWQMATLTEQIEQLRLQISQVASDERALAKELSDSLRQAGKQLRQEVRLAAAEHEAPRSTILGELDALASRLACFRNSGGRALLLMMNCVIYYRRMSRPAGASRAIMGSAADQDN